MVYWVSSPDYLTIEDTTITPRSVLYAMVCQVNEKTSVNEISMARTGRIGHGAMFSRPIHFKQREGVNYLVAIWNREKGSIISWLTPKVQYSDCCETNKDKHFSVGFWRWYRHGLWSWISRWLLLLVVLSRVCWPRAGTAFLTVLLAIHSRKRLSQLEAGCPCPIHFPITIILRGIIGINVWPNFLRCPLLAMAVFLFNIITWIILHSTWLYCTQWINKVWPIRHVTWWEQRVIKK